MRKYEVIKKRVSFPFKYPAEGKRISKRRFEVGERFLVPDMARSAVIHYVRYLLRTDQIKEIVEEAAKEKPVKEEKKTEKPEVKTEIKKEDTNRGSSKINPVAKKPKNSKYKDKE